MIASSLLSQNKLAPCRVNYLVCSMNEQASLTTPGPYCASKLATPDEDQLGCASVISHTLNGATGVVGVWIEECLSSPYLQLSPPLAALSGNNRGALCKGACSFASDVSSCGFCSCVLARSSQDYTQWKKTQCRTQCLRPPSESERSSPGGGSWR